MKPIPSQTALSRHRTMVLFALAAVALSGCVHMNPSPASTKAATLTGERIAGIVSSPDRNATDRRLDPRRKPGELLAFIGVTPGMVVLDLGAGGGYTTELLARAVGPSGRVYGQSAPRASPPPAGRPSSPEALAQRARNSGLANLVAVVRPYEDPVPPDLASGKLDLVTFMFNYHDLGHMGVDRERLNTAVFAALKPGGLFVIADHAGRPGTGISESGTLHRIEADYLRREVEAVGFRQTAQADFLRNPSDPRDRNVPDGGQAKDGFVLKFVKP